MEFALSTHWNAGRHASGESMIEEIRSLGFTSVELGYDLRLELVEGVVSAVKRGDIKVVSLHNFCPVPMGATRGHPEIYTLGAVDKRERENAVTHTTRTLRFAAEVGARFVVTHAGNVEMDSISRQMFDLIHAGQQYSDFYEKLKLKAQVQRDKKAPKQIDGLRTGIEALLPVIEETGVKLAIENLPTWEAIPTEVELEKLLQTYGDRGLRYWHDMGHAQIRQNLGFINMERWMDRLKPWMAGMHVHDVSPPATDHVMPPLGQIDFQRFQRFGSSDIVRVIEPTTRTPKEEIVEGLRYLQEKWAAAPSS